LTKKLVIKNLVPLSLLIVFIVVSNCVWTKVTKFSKILTTSDFCFKRKIYVYIEQSSTMVKKYLLPWIDGIEYGPHRSTWIKSKHFLDLDVLRGKGSLFCFAKWQTSQTKDLLYLTKGNLFLITSIDLFETCPSQKCQRFSRSLAVKLKYWWYVEMWQVLFKGFDKKRSWVYKVYFSSQLNQSFSKNFYLECDNH